MICLVVGGQGLCLFLVLHAGISTSVCVFDFIDFSAEYACVCVCVRCLCVKHVITSRTDRLQFGKWIYCH